MHPAQSALQFRKHVCLVAVLLTGSASAGEFSFPFPTPANHLRVATWNLEFFNDRDPPRTAAQLDLLAHRLISLDASVVMLQEIDQAAALHDLRNRMGGGWQAFGGSLAGIFPQQNAILYDVNRVHLKSAEFIYALDNWYYPELTYRTPVTAVFAPNSNPQDEFRVITFHGHWNSAALRDEEGYWLGDYVQRLLSEPLESDRIMLLGDFNGDVGAAPHTGIAAGGRLDLVPKRNGELTTVYEGYQIDHVYVTDAANARLTDPTAFVVRPEYFGETGVQFQQTYSDHLPVFIDYAVVDVPEPHSITMLCIAAAILGSRLLRGRRQAN